MLKWFSTPHYHYTDGELQEWKRDFRRSEHVHIINCKPVLRNGAIRIFLNDNSVYDVAWDTVLMACEEKYEHFGGFTEESKKTVQEWFQKAM
ncbi:MAG: hypothetical protein GY795_09060 [Desulfobacterales bacterium]|nr:hypothetical protein [Desulfobacterales bacterium]